MRSEADKAEVELAIFREFVEQVDLNIPFSSLRKGDAVRKEPDILCLINGLDAAFELVEACAPEFKALATKAQKSESGIAVGWGADLSGTSIRKKLCKHYSPKCPIHLLIYKNDYTIVPDEMIIHDLCVELRNGLGPFSSIWLMGDSLHRVAWVQQPDFVG